LTFHRVLGWTAIYSSSCDNGTDIRVITFNTDLDLDRYLNPIVLILCYYIVAITSKVLLGPQVRIDTLKKLHFVLKHIDKLNEKRFATNNTNQYKCVFRV
jgi:hypothetical protein